MYIIILKRNYSLLLLNALFKGLLTRLLVPRPRRDQDYSRYNPRRDRDETFVIRGETETRPRRLYKRPRRDRDETFVLLPQALHETMRDACAAMPYNTPPPSYQFLRNANVNSNELHAQVTL